MLNHPTGIDSHVVGNHVGGHANASLPGAPTQVVHGIGTAQVAGDFVIIQRVGRGHSFRVAHHLLDALGSYASFPQADEPQAVDAAAGERIQLLVGNLIQAGDRTLVLFRKLVEPDIGVFGQQDDLGHPIEIGAVMLQLEFLFGERRRFDGAGTGENRFVLFGDEIEAAEQAIEICADVLAPLDADVFQLPVQGVGRGQGRSHEQVDQCAGAGFQSGLTCKIVLQRRHDIQIGAAFFQIRIVEEFQVG